MSMTAPSKIPVFFHPNQLKFQPLYEWAMGVRVKHPETTRRAESIHKKLSKNENLFEFHTPSKIPMTQIRALHRYDLLTLYTTATRLGPEEVFYPSVFPQTVDVKPDPNNIRHAGFYCFDSGTPIDANVLESASWSAASAVEAAKHVARGKSRVAYALCRPPGHHATADSYGGYCYFNNSALAVRHLQKSGRVVLLDIDFHHGNGAQEVFYEDPNCLTISLHGDPRKYFPFFIGFPSETGRGKGEGYNLNLILPEECTWKQYEKLLKTTVFPTIQNYEPDYLVVSAGFDTYVKDPVGRSKIETADYKKMGEKILGFNLPTVIVQEGGYFAKDLGSNVSSFLEGFVK